VFLYFVIVFWTILYIVYTLPKPFYTYGSSYINKYKKV
jgi:hypothetical protein